MDGNRIIEFLKSGDVTQDIWDEVVGAILDAEENDEDAVSCLRAALGD